MEVAMGDTVELTVLQLLLEKLRLTVAEADREAAPEEMWL
jgi:hypothetical protein